MAFATPLIPHAVAKYIKNNRVAPPPAVSRLHSNNISPERIRRLKQMKDDQDRRWRYERVKEHLVQRIKGGPQRSKLHTEAGARLIQEAVERICKDSNLVFKVSEETHRSARSASRGSNRRFLRPPRSVPLFLPNQNNHLISSSSKGFLLEQETKLLSALEPIPAPPPIKRSNNSDTSDSTANNCNAGATAPPGSAEQKNSGIASQIFNKIDTWQLINAYESFAEQQTQQEAKAKEVRSSNSHAVILQHSQLLYE